MQEGGEFFDRMTGWAGGQDGEGGIVTNGRDGALSEA